MNRSLGTAVRSVIVLPVLVAVFGLGTQATLAAAPPPPSATTGAVTSVTPTSALVTGVVNPNGTATTWYFQYGLSTSPGYTSNTSARSAGAGSADDSVSRGLTGLAPATSYHYRVVALSSAGTTYGANGIFNTTAAPTAVTGAASKVSAAGATLNGVVNPQGQTTSWYFEYGSSTSYGTKTTATTLGAGPNDQTVSAAISGLAPKSTYHFRLVATSSAGKSYGVDHTFTTDLSVTLNASLSTITYGGFVVLSGRVASGLAGAHVTVLDEPFNGSSFTGLAAVVTLTGGAWNYSAQPTVRTTYEATTGGGTSSPVVVNVRPVVYLNVIASGQLSTRVVGSVSFGAHVLQLQRLSKGLWVTWKHVRLNGSSKAVFSTSLPKGRTLVRMAIGPFVPGIDQAAPGYLAGYSRALTYVVH